MATSAGCVACGAASTLREEMPAPMPPVEWCDVHWNEYQTDWFLLGRCVDHYGEALRWCATHDREIEPL